MRYIDLSKIEIPEGWLEKANGLAQQLNEVDSDEARDNIIAKNQIWRELFVPLSNLSKGK